MIQAAKWSRRVLSSPNDCAGLEQECRKLKPLRDGLLLETQQKQKAAEDSRELHRTILSLQYISAGVRRAGRLMWEVGAELLHAVAEHGYVTQLQLTLLYYQ